MIIIAICAVVLVVIVFVIIIIPAKCPKCSNKLIDESGFYQLIDLKTLVSSNEYEVLLQKSKYVHGSRCNNGVNINYSKCQNCGWYSIKYCNE